MGRIEADRWITGEPWSSTTGPKNTIKEDTLRSERRTTLKKDLPEPTLLEMSGNPTTQGLSVLMHGKGELTPQLEYRIA